MFFKIVGAFFAVVSFCFLIELPKKYMIYAGITGMIGWAVYLLGDIFLQRAEIDAFISTIVIAAMSHILARILKAPVSIFLIPGILPIVPGGALYRSAYAFINESNYFNMYLDETLKIAGAIALGMFFVDSVFKLHLPGRKKGKRR